MSMSPRANTVPQDIDVEKVASQEPLLMRGHPLSSAASLVTSLFPSTSAKRRESDYQAKRLIATVHYPSQRVPRWVLYIFSNPSMTFSPTVATVYHLPL